MRDVWALIQSFNQNRNPEILPRKYVSLRKNAFTFFRGTCHLFYHDLPANFIHSSAPSVWICGDLHLENFGTYKGDDLQIYFGINDFDEGGLAPCTWDVTRLVTSIFVAADSLAIDSSAARTLAESYLTSYAHALTTGRIRAIVADNAHGIVEDLLIGLHQRKRINLLDERTESMLHRRGYANDDLRQLRFDSEKVLKIDKQLYRQIAQTIHDWADTQANPEFFEVLDIGFRLAGTGSLGIDRYLILVKGKGSPDRNYLLDFKQQPVSALQPYLSKIQPQWANQATRVMRIQQLVQSAPPALSAAIEFDNSSYFLRELQPTQDKIDLKATRLSLTQLDRLITTMALVTASAHLHGSGKSGAAIADDLMTFGTSSDWQEQILSYANEYAKQVQQDYQDFGRSSSSSSVN
jgi:uncharacterized protein (DUF2252 family)